METDRIRMETDSNILDIRFLVSFLFPPPRMETDLIRMEADSDISDIHFPVFLLFPSLGLIYCISVPRFNILARLHVICEGQLVIVVTLKVQ